MRSRQRRAAALSLGVLISVAGLFALLELDFGVWAPGIEARAQQPSLKEILGRAQSQSEKKAVEDLIGKLQSPAAKPPDAAAKAPAPPPAGKEAGPAVAAPATPAPGAPEVAKPAAPSEPPVASSAPPTVPPEAAVERADLPSVDLEVYFAYGSAEVTPKAAAALATLGRALSDPRLAASSFLIAGHTDAKGGASYNLALSERRAESVRRFLIANFAIDQTRLVAKGYGQQRLKNAAKPLAAENRRVQVVNISKP